MKKITIFTLALIMVFTACQTEKNLKMEVYKTGSVLTDKIIDTYLQVQKIAITSQYMQNFADILTDADTIKYAPEISEAENIYVFIMYKELLNKFDKKYEPAFNVSDDDIKRQALSLLMQIDTLHPKMKDTTDKIRKYINSFKFNPDYVLYQITDLLVKLYQKDVKFWQRTLDSTYNEYVFKIDNVSNDVFDYEKLKQIIAEPCKDPKKLAEIYKLNLKKDAYKFKSQFNDKSAKFYLSLKTFQDLLAEFLKRNPDYDFIYYEIQRIKNETGIQNEYTGQ